MQMFRNSKEYATKLGAKAAAKIHDTYLAVEKYLRERPEGGFDDFVEFFLAEEGARDSAAMKVDRSPTL